MRRSSFHASLWFAAATAACDPCRNRVESDVGSPDHHHVRAVVYARRCGLSRASTEVSVMASDQPPEGEGNALTVTDRTGRLPQGPAGGPTVRTRWLSRDSLEVRYDERADAAVRDTVLWAVKVVHVRDTT
jgi:hypothetical protein